MCLAIPGKITKVEGHKVFVQYPGEERQALVGNEQLHVGDFVMVQMGIVIKILTPEEAAQAQEAWSVH
jgi:hydrogenase expression/formation protein HypC